MKKVPLNELKEDLSGYTERVHKGETIEITKYNQPYIRLVPVQHQGVLYGSLVGKATLSSPLSEKRNLLKTILQTLEEDRA